MLGVTRSGYYAWRSRHCQPDQLPGVAASRRAAATAQLSEAIIAIYQAHRGRYGAPRIHAALCASGLRCSRKRVARLMRLHRLRGHTPKRWRAARRASEDALVSPNLINQQFTADHANQRWLSDTTQIPTGGGKLYLAVVLDVYSRRIVGWSFGASEHEGLVTAAVRMALTRRQLSPAGTPMQQPGLILHSDRGRAYCSTGYRAVLAKYQIQQSMSGSGNCYDNAMMESFFATLKRELVRHRSFASLEQARTAIVEYIEVYYNQQRSHSALAYQSPAGFENSAIR